MWHLIPAISAGTVCRRHTRSRVVAQPQPSGEENINTDNTARVGQKRTTSGTAADNPKPKHAPTVQLDAAMEKRLYDAVSTMLVAQRYVDEWKVEGVQKWLMENQNLEIPVGLLEEYFDRVDQSLPENIPHVLYDVAEKTVHRDY